MAHTADSIQSWIDSYTFVDNATASQDIIQNIIRELEGHGYVFGPTSENGYTLTISGDLVNETFVVKADEA